MIQWQWTSVVECDFRVDRGIFYSTSELRNPYLFSSQPVFAFSRSRFRQIIELPVTLYVKRSPARSPTLKKLSVYTTVSILVLIRAIVFSVASSHTS